MINPIRSIKNTLEDIIRLLEKKYYSNNLDISNLCFVGKKNSEHEFFELG